MILHGHNLMACYPSPSGTPVCSRFTHVAGYVTMSTCCARVLRHPVGTGWIPGLPFHSTSVAHSFGGFSSEQRAPACTSVLSVRAAVVCGSLRSGKAGRFRLWCGHGHTVSEIQIFNIF